MSSSKEYLQQRRNRWYAVVEVPKPLRGAAKRLRYVKSLGTESLSEANRLKHTYVSEFKRRIKALEQEQGDPQASLYRLAAEFRHELETASKRIQEGPHGHTFTEYEEELDRLREAAQEIEESHGPESAQKFFKAGKGEATFIKDHYPVWLAQHGGTEQTKSQYKSTVDRYLAWTGQDMTVEETTRRKAAEYIQVLWGAGLARKTIGRHLTALSSLWRWLMSSGLAARGDNPWREHELSRGNKAPTIRRLDDAALLKLLNAKFFTKRYGQILPDLLRLGLLTGARLDALCSLRSSSVEKRPDGYWLTIMKDKTEAGTRVIPLHEAGEAIISRRLRDKDDFVFAGLTPGGHDGKRSWNVSKAYSRFRKKADVSGSGEVFHALRNVFIEHMEKAGVPESTTKLLVGHARESITYGHYSKGEYVALREAINKLDYGKVIMEAIREPQAT